MHGGENVVDREQLDRATKLLIAGLKQSKALNNRIRKALQQREQANAARQSASGSDVYQLLEDITRNFE